MKRKELESLGAELDQISLEWMEENHPGLADAIEEAVEQGVTPRTIKRYVLDRVGRPELALRCEQAARAAAAI